MAAPGAAGVTGVQAGVSPLSLLALGYSVLPSGGGDKSKAPLVAWTEYQRRLPTEAEVRVWDAELHPRLWGVVTGTISGLVVLDADTPEARALMGDLEPHTITPRGAHYYFQHPGHHVKTVAGILPGLDIRGDGGFCNILGPGYNILRMPTLDALHPWERLPERIRLALERTPQATVPPSDGGDTISEGRRNQRLTRMAGALRRQGATQEAIGVALLGVNRSQCSPPLPEAEVRRIAASVAKYEPAGLRMDRVRWRRGRPLLPMVEVGP